MTQYRSQPLKQKMRIAVRKDTVSYRTVSFFSGSAGTVSERFGKSASSMTVNHEKNRRHLTPACSLRLGSCGKTVCFADRFEDALRSFSAFPGLLGRTSVLHHPVFVDDGKIILH